MKVEEFASLSRDEMYAELKSRYPFLAKGMSRAPKATLIRAFEMGVDTDIADLAMVATADPPPPEPTSELVVSGDVELGLGPTQAVKTGVERTKFGYVGEVPSRREEVAKALNTLPRSQLILIATYKAAPDGNRHARRRRDALLHQARRVLPRGVTLEEALAAIG